MRRSNHPIRHFAGRQRGLAILVVLLMISLMVTLLGFLFEDQYIFHKRLENQLTHQQGYQIALGAEAWASRVLIEDELPLIDGWFEDWAKLGQEPEPSEAEQGLFNAEDEEQPANIDFGVGELQIKVNDLQAKYNINNLAVADPNLRKQQQRLFLNILEINEIGDDSFRQELYGATLDWLDENDLRGAFGFESADYESLDAPYLAADQQLVSLGELLNVRGYSQEIIQTLSKYMTVLPANQIKLNLNTVSPEVLASLSLSPVFDITPASNFLQVRDDEEFAGFTTNAIQDAITMLPTVSSIPRQPITTMLQLTSQFFEVQVKVRLADLNFCLSSVLYREPSQNEGVLDPNDPLIKVVSRQYNRACYEDFS